MDFIWEYKEEVASLIVAVGLNILAKNHTEKVLNKLRNKKSSSSDSQFIGNSQDKSQNSGSNQQTQETIKSTVTHKNSFDEKLDASRNNISDYSQNKKNVQGKIDDIEEKYDKISPEQQKNAKVQIRTCPLIALDRDSISTFSRLTPVGTP